MQYFFILGNHLRLSLAELICLFPKTQYQTQANFAVFDFATKIDCTKIQNQLGGTIKIGAIIKKINFDDLITNATQSIMDQGNTDKKVYFGLSVYNNSIDIKKIALCIKKKLKEQGISSRWVQSKEPALSSVIVKTNKLLSGRGCEIVVLKLKGDLWLGKTAVVQPFAEFSRRDYGRPARDSKSGMLPPKLARMMINLAQIKPEAVILDPFCGSGTILQEALILGYKNIIGSDVSKKAVEKTKQNLIWLRDQNIATQGKQVKILQTDVRLLAKFIKAKSIDPDIVEIDVIITEPYLGPPARKRTSTPTRFAKWASLPLKTNEPISKIKRIIRELELLYLDSFKEFKKILKPYGKIVIIFPVINDQKLEILENIFILGFQQDQKFINLYNNVKRQSFLYSRPGQMVKREIFIFNYCGNYGQSR